MVSYCFTTSAEEEGTKCGQKFANDKRIKVVEFGAVAVGNQSFYAALGNKKPTVGGVELLPVDAQRKNGFALFGTNDSVLGPWGTFGKNVLKAKTAAVVYMQVPGIDYGAQVEKASLESAGIKTTHGRLCRERDRPDRAADRRGRPERRHDRPADARERLRRRRQGARAAREEQDAGRLEPALPRPRCGGGARRDLAKWDYGIASSLGFDVSDPAVPPFLKGLKAVGQPKLAADAWVIVAWGQILTTVKLMNQIGVRKVTSANFTRAIRAFKGPQALGAPSLNCGKYPAEPAACNDQTQFFQY